MEQGQRVDHFRTLKILHLALVTGLTILLITSLVSPDKKTDESFERILQVVAVVVSLSCLLVGFNLFKKRLVVVRNMTGDAESRMNAYRAACIVWWAMLEGPGLLAAIGFLLTGNYAFFALALFHVAILAVFMPRKENIVLLLNLTADETARLEGKA